MQLSLAGLLQAWHDFFSVIGASAATLVGLMFVAVSIGAGSFSSERGKIAIRTFLSPTVLHFSAVLIASLVAMIPNETWTSFGILLCVVGLIGAGYSLWNSRRMSKHGITATIDIIDRLWYASLPILFYLLIVAAGISHSRTSIRRLMRSRLH
jgi:hypothetical protein